MVILIKRRNLYKIGELFLIGCDLTVLDSYKYRIKIEYVRSMDILSSFADDDDDEDLK